MDKIINYIGIDITKASFMTTFNEINKPKQFENTNQGINHFFKYIEQLNLKKDNTIIGVESTGSYHF